MVNSDARRRGIRLKTEAPAQEPGASHGPDADALTFTHIKAIVPQVLSKRFSLDEHGILVKQSAAQLSEGRCKTVRVHDLAEFGAYLDTLGSGDALTFGTTPGYESARVVTKARIGDAAPPAGTIARSREYFQFHRGPGILMLDYDPKKGTEALTPAALIALVREVAPPLAAVPLLWRPSASSGICLPGGEALTGIAGQRLYIPVQDAGRIPEGGAALVTLLWAAGHGRYDIGTAGQALERTTVDASVWQPERLDFAGAPVVGRGLERHAPPSFTVGDPAALLDLCDLIALVDGDVVEAAKAARTAEKGKVQSEARTAREAWVEEHAPGLAKRRGVDLDTARGVLRQASEGHKLFGDFELVTDAGEVVTVGELLDHPDRWHNTRFCDPLEPSYHNDPRIAWANLRSGRRPYIYSHAHGGRRFTLVRPSARLELAVDQKPRVLDETLDVLRAQVEVFDSSDGMGLLRVTDDARILPVTEDWLGDHLDRAVSYYALRADRQGHVTEAAACAPGWLPKRLRAKVGERRLPRLRSVATMPTLRLDGSVVQEAGYDTASRMLLLSDTPTLPVIPKAPSVAEVRAAVETLWGPFRLFPLVGPVDRGAVLSALLTACVRPQLPAAPGHGFDAPAAGTGKTC